MKLTRELRQKIIKDFARKHRGIYAPDEFVKEVRTIGKSHPAYDWFEWDEEKAIWEYHLWQAREFAVGLVVRFEIQEIGRNQNIVVREVEMPLVLSPVEDRSIGGGYYLSDPTDPEHMAEYCRQASVALTSWLKRYGAALAYAKGSVKTVERQLELLKEHGE